MRFPRILLVLAVTTAALGPVVGCAAPVAEEEAGAADSAVSGAERAAVMDALRAKVKPSLNNQDIVFNVSSGHFASAQGFTFLTGKIELRNGEPVDYRGTAYQADIDEGLFDDNFSALLQKKDGKWTVLASDIGATDVSWWGWWDAYRAPRTIFPGGEQEQVAPAADRRAIMDALRAKVKPLLRNQDIVFDVSDGKFKQSGSFAFLFGKIRLRSGAEVDYRGTEFQADIDEGMFDDNISALLEKQGDGWVVKVYAMGSTDVPWEGWPAEYGAPADITR